MILLSNVDKVEIWPFGEALSALLHRLRRDTSPRGKILPAMSVLLKIHKSKKFLNWYPFYCTMTDGISFEIKGLDEVKRDLKQLKHKCEDLSGEHLIPLKDLLTPDFLTKYTDFNSLDAMFHASDITIESEEDFKNVPDDKWNEFISKHTRFPNWEEMQGKAAEEYFIRKLGLK